MTPSKTAAVDLHSLPWHPILGEGIKETLDNPTRFVYRHLESKPDWGGIERHTFAVEPVGSPALHHFTNEWGKHKTYSYDPALVEPEDDRFGTNFRFKGHPEWRQQAWRDEGGELHTFDTETPAEEGLIYRGLSHEEWEEAKQRGYFQSQGKYNIGGEQGTMFSTEPGQAGSYATGFAPWFRKPGFQTPSYVVGVPRPADAYAHPNMTADTTEIVVPGQVPFNQVQRAWQFRPYEVQHGDVDVRSEDYGKTWFGQPYFQTYNVYRPINPLQTTSARRMTHPHFLTGQPCDCTFYRPAGRLAAVKMADKFHDFLLNPKSRPDLQTPKAQMFLKALKRFHNEKTDALMPWLTKEWKRGRLGEGVSGSWLKDALMDHPVAKALPPEIQNSLRAYHEGQLAESPEGWDVPGLYEEAVRGHHTYPSLFYTTPRNTSAPLRPENLDHWGDFLHSNHRLRRELGDINKHDITSFSQRIHDWDEAMKQEAHQRALEGGELVHQTPDGWTVRRLRTPEELDAEGDAMGHCVGGDYYARAVENGSTQIYSLRDPEGRPHATAEIYPDHEMSEGPGGGRIVQIQGRGNEQPKPEYQAKLKDWFTSMPESHRPTWADPPGPIEHIGGIMPEAESYASDGQMVRGEYDEDEGGYGAHGDYGLVQPYRRINYLPVLQSLIRPKSYDQWHSQQHGDGPYPMDFDQKEVEALYQEALRRKEIPQLADAVTQYDQDAQDALDTVEQHRLDYDPSYYGYPGESWDEEPERWQEIVNSGLNGELEWGSPFRAVETPEEAFNIARRSYDETQQELYDFHVPSQVASALWAKINPHWVVGPEGNGSYRNYTERERGVEDGTFSKVTHIPHAPLYKRWAFSPSTGEVELADNNANPLQVRYHQDLAARLNEPGLIHGYAYRIGNGWRLTDWESQPITDPFVIAQVMRTLNGASKESSNGWEFSGDDWDRCHHGLPG